MWDYAVAGVWLIIFLVLAGLYRAGRQIGKMRRSRRENILAMTAEALDMEVWDARQLQPPFDFPVFRYGRADILLSTDRGEAKIYVGELTGLAPDFVGPSTLAIVDDPALNLPAFLVWRPFPHKWIQPRYLVPGSDEDLVSGKGSIETEFRVLEDPQSGKNCRILCDYHDEAARLFDAASQDVLVEGLEQFSTIAGYGSVFFINYYTDMPHEFLIPFAQFTFRLHDRFRAAQEKDVPDPGRLP